MRYFICCALARCVPGDVNEDKNENNAELIALVLAKGRKIIYDEKKINLLWHWLFIQVESMCFDANRHCTQNDGNPLRHIEILKTNNAIMTNTK